ncbi:unnamed protein product [Kuraishia capsulata CBS 1993]|uniref:C2H2-type domain-containing protein n=1 Tax=Kuraishia capsulata CBS 1993 TaxID=1382522 RepID=W6MTI8_9ASCO|nr:uncharacterized protein KUCA_T00006044001 [Kuraishia capsulata CBS 1993]CDK30049.1 unnamed protein product [Kuraishia capsulata CBS 1993]
MEQNGKMTFMRAKDNPNSSESSSPEHDHANNAGKEDVAGHRCDFPGCHKSFSRREHLSRHQLNHYPKKVYRCEWDGCSKTFVRNDLLQRHLKRHKDKEQKRSSKRHQIGKTLDRHNSVGDDVGTGQSDSEDDRPMTVVPKTESFQVDELPPEGSSSKSLISWLFNDSERDSGTDSKSSTADAGLGSLSYPTNGDLFLTGPFDISPNAMMGLLQNVNTSTTNSPAPDLFPDHDRSIISRLTESKVAELGQTITDIQKNSNFTLKRLERMLDMYWNFFHPRFPILHKPTFVAADSPPVLLLAMAMMGSKLAGCVSEQVNDIDQQIDKPSEFALAIAKPLRWLIFSSPHFHPPAKIWIIQSLLILEFYEKNCSIREMHERAHLHHGTTVQLLRRSPSLGGNPFKLDEMESSENIYNKWIEAESMKRSTLMCFYMDAIDAISFGHQILIYAHQIQMTMPCDDSLWENALTANPVKPVNGNVHFLVALKNLLNGIPVKTNSFGKKVLVSGICSIMYQMQQRELQASFGLDGKGSSSGNWRQMLIAAFAVWRNDVGGSCCSSRTAIENTSSAQTSLLAENQNDIRSPQFSESDTRCKCIAYHMAHIFMSISHYDFMIFAGAPWRMNVKPTLADRQAISKRVYDWSKSEHGKICALQSYLLLWEMFLSPQDGKYEFNYEYDASTDIFFRSNVVGLCVIVLWCYNFCNYGPESYFLSIEGEAEDGVAKAEQREDGYHYLRRIRTEMTGLAGGICLHTWYSNMSGNVFYNALKRHASILLDVKNKEYIVGLCQMVSKMLWDADYSVAREHARLLQHCAERSMGSHRIVKEDMYM